MPFSSEIDLPIITAFSLHYAGIGVFFLLFCEVLCTICIFISV